MNRDPNYEIWERSEKLTRSFWDSYNRLIKSTKIHHLDQRNEIINETTHPRNHSSFDQPPDDVEDDQYGQETVNKEYLEFIRITRQHQIERDRLKKIELAKKNAEPEEYYTDLSELNTLALDNFAEIPDRDEKGKESRQEKLIKLYGSSRARDKIRSMEMSIDEIFKTKCQEMNPKFWPVIPINPKPYLNKLKSKD